MGVAAGLGPGQGTGIAAQIRKMRREGLVDYEWKESDAGPPRKYYELTAKGREQLRETLDYWSKISGTVKNLGNK